MWQGAYAPRTPEERTDNIRRATRAVAGRPPAMRSPAQPPTLMSGVLPAEANERSRRGLARRKPERPLRFRTRAPNPLPQATRAGTRRARAARTPDRHDGHITFFMRTRGAGKAHSSNEYRIKKCYAPLSRGMRGQPDRRASRRRPGRRRRARSVREAQIHLPGQDSPRARMQRIVSPKRDSRPKTRCALLQAGHMARDVKHFHAQSGP